MIFGVGTDLVELKRIEKSYARWGDRLVDHLLTEAERRQFDKTRFKVRFLAMRFAGKEAVVKALGTGFRQGMWLRDVAILNEPSGKPVVEFSDNGNRIRAGRGAGDCEISLTDEAGLVVAFAVMMKK